MHAFVECGLARRRSRFHVRALVATLRGARRCCPGDCPRWALGAGAEPGPAPPLMATLHFRLLPPADVAPSGARGRHHLQALRSALVCEQQTSHLGLEGRGFTPSLPGLPLLCLERLCSSLWCRHYVLAPRHARASARGFFVFSKSTHFSSKCLAALPQPTRSSAFQAGPRCWPAGPTPALCTRAFANSTSQRAWGAAYLYWAHGFL